MRFYANIPVFHDRKKYEKNVNFWANRWHSHVKTEVQPLKQLNGLDAFVVILNLVIVAGVGLLFSRFNQNTRDYFKAGGKLPWFIASISLFVSGFSAFMFVAAAGFTYRNGLSSVLVFTSAFWAYVLGFFLFGKLWHRARIDSPMQLLTRRFSQSTTYFYSLAAVFPNILLMGALIYTLCIFINSALGFGTIQVSFGSLVFSGFELTAIGIGVVLLLYTVLGGLWAVTITDTLQFLIMLLMTLTVFPLSLLHLGEGSLMAGISELKRSAPAGYFSLFSGNIGLLFLLAFCFQNILGYNANWHIGQRYYSVAEEQETRKIAAVCAIFSLIIPLLWIFPVMVSRVIFPDLGAIWPHLKEPSEASFASLCLLILPHGMLGVVVSAILAASMSSADSTFNWLAAVITKDVYVPLYKTWKNGRLPSEKAQLLVGKSAVFVVGIAAIALSLSMQKFGGSFDIYLKIYSWTTPALFTPVLLGMMYRKTPWWSAMAAVVAGVAAVLAANIWVTIQKGIQLNALTDLLQPVSLALGDLHFGRFEINVFVGMVTSAFVFWLSARWPDKNPAHAARIAAFDRDLRTPIQTGYRPVDREKVFAYMLVGKLSGVIGLILIAVAFALERSEDRWINALCGFGAVLFGALFYRMARHYLGGKNA